MIHRFKKLTQLKGKKRYIVLGLLGLELMSLPAAAQIVHKTAFEARPIVTAVEIPTTELGVSRFFVSSNAGFDIKANNIAGDVSVKVHVSGQFSPEHRFGDAAQLPGPKTTCAHAATANAAIYKADRKTALRERANTTDRAVIFEITYDPTQKPDFNFVAGQDRNAALSSCIYSNI